MNMPGWQSDFVQLKSSLCPIASRSNIVVVEFRMYAINGVVVVVVLVLMVVVRGCLIISLLKFYIN